VVQADVVGQRPATTEKTPSDAWAPALSGRAFACFREEPRRPPWVQSRIRVYSGMDEVIIIIAFTW
jgi:hypothetical protein